MTTLATAFVEMRPDMTGFGTRLSTSTRLASEKAGSTAARSFTSRFAAGLKIAAVVGGAMAVAAGGRFLSGAIREASDLGESINAVNVTFGRAAGGIKRLGEDAATAVGLSKNEFNGLAVQFAGFAKTIAGDGGNVTRTMDDLTTRGADFASVMNLDVSESMRLFQSGLAGETEPLRKFGIDLSAAAVESYALAEGIAKPGQEMTEQMKVQARYGSLMQQTAKVQGDFANTSDSLANRQRILSANFKDLQASIGTALLPIVTAFVGFLNDRGLPALKAFGGFITDTVVPAGRRFVGMIKDVVGEMRARFGPEISEAIDRAKDAFNGLVDAGAAIIGWMRRNKTVVTVFAGTVTGLAVAVGVARVAMTLFTRALAVNPITLVVVAIAALAAGLVYAYKKSDTFREIVQGAWRMLKSSAMDAWDRVKPILADLREGLGRVVAFVKDNWPTIKEVMKSVLNACQDIVRGAFKVIRGIVTVVMGLIKGDWKDVWEGIKDILSGIWDVMKGVVKAALAIVKAAIKLGWAAVKELTGAAWDWIKGKISDAWKSIKSNVGDALDGVKSILSTAWGKIKSGASRAWEGIVKAVKAAFDIIKKTVGSPVYFVLETIINDKLIAGFNKISGFVNGPEIDKIPTSGIPHFAKGGVMPGYSPGKDNMIAAVSGGEAIMRPEWTKAVGKDTIDKMNRMAAAGGEQALKHYFAGAFAGGGVVVDRSVVWPTVGTTVHRTPYNLGHDGMDINQPPGPDVGAPIFAFRDGPISYVGSGRGYGIPAVFQNTSVGEVVYGHMTKANVNSRTSAKAGDVLGWVGSSGNADGAHLHFGFPGGTFYQAEAALQGSTKLRGNAYDASAAGGGFSLPGWVQNPLSTLNDAIGDLLDNKVFDSPLGAIMKAIPGKMIGGMVDFLQDKINIFSSSKTGVGTGITLKPGSGTVKQIVFGMAKQMGWHGPQLVALDKLITQESGWNPQADNPTSSAAGLFQKMTSLHGPLENTVAGQAEWGLNYIKQAYGSPIRAWNFHTRNNWYDEGGVARGQGFMPKGTIQPERVLSPRQTDLHDRQTVALERLAAGGGNGRMHLTITNWRDGTGYIESVVDSVNDSDRAFERRRGRMFQ